MGVVLFGETLNPAKSAGIVLAIAGIVALELAPG
jgi:multidrug transporter EmrE-like cation transporter